MSILWKSLCGLAVWVCLVGMGCETGKTPTEANVESSSALGSPVQKAAIPPPQAEDPAQARIDEKERARGEKAVAEITAMQGPEYGVLDLSGLPRRGPVDAPIQIVRFEDLQCPACMTFRHTMQELIDTYPEHIAVYFVHFPLSSKCNADVAMDMHPAACDAALALVCAQDQNGFWPMQESVFAYLETAIRSNQRVSQFTEDMATELAQANNLDAVQLVACMKDPNTMDRLKAQVAVGSQAKVTSTPTWFLNGYRRKSGASFATVQPQIEKLLELHNAAP